MDTQKFYTYILYSQKTNKFYIGSTQDIDGRLHRHNSGHTPSTKSGIPWEMKYHEEYSTRAEAMNREMYIKSQKSKKYIEKLISSSDG